MKKKNPKGAGRKPLKDRSVIKKEVRLYVEEHKIEALGVDKIRDVSYKAIDKEVAKKKK